MVEEGAWINLSNRLPRGDGEYSVRTVENNEVQAWFISRKEIFVTLDGADGVEAVCWKQKSRGYERV